MNFQFRKSLLSNIWCINDAIFFLQVYTYCAILPWQSFIKPITWSLTEVCVVSPWKFNFTTYMYTLVCALDMNQTYLLYLCYYCPMSPYYGPIRDMTGDPRIPQLENLQPRPRLSRVISYRKFGFAYNMDATSRSKISCLRTRKKQPFYSACFFLFLWRSLCNINTSQIAVAQRMKDYRETTMLLGQRGKKSAEIVPKIYQATKI